jgi:hypothetical protein
MEPSAPTLTLPPAVTASVADRVRLDAFPYSVAAGDGSVWVVLWDGAHGQYAVAHVDPLTDRVVATIPLEGLAYNLAVGDGAAWVPIYVFS